MVPSVTSELILLPFLSVTLHESGNRNALLGSWLNNTEVYLTPFISTQIHTIVFWQNNYTNLFSVAQICCAYFCYKMGIFYVL